VADGQVSTVGEVSADATSDAFDVERFRAVRTRSLVVRRPTRPMVVLGSTQPSPVVARSPSSPAGVALVRRRSGGGAVFVDPLDPIWVDLWVPHDDELFDEDVGRSSVWVGECWAAALEGLGVERPEVHRGPLLARAWSDLVCFAGLGPGEVVVGDRKVVGVAQWRSRQGSLFHSAAYRRWDPAPLISLFALDARERARMTSDLGGTAVGLDELLEGPTDTDVIVSAVLDRLPGGSAWQVLTPEM